MTRFHQRAAVFCITGAVLLAASSCTSLIFDDRSGCEHGLMMSFRYDYNLHRADMFSGHVGEVTLYVFDEQGRFVTSRTEGNTDAGSPLSEDGYSMYIDLPEGNYRFIALAQQGEYKDSADEPGAQFIRNIPSEGEDITGLTVDLECTESRTDGNIITVNHGNMPLDTLWHGITEGTVNIPAEGGYAKAEMSLVRNTKNITVVLQDLDNPGKSKVENYEFGITDHNARLLYDNSVDGTDAVLYTPYATWNTSDSRPEAGTGDMAHAEFMTSRIIYHEDPDDDARLIVRERESGIAVIDVNLPELLSRMAGYDELQRYEPQEFLDRGYDYDLTFFLSRKSWSYVTVNIETLGWSKRIQNINL